mgnify:CR=1 FL=1
MKITKEQLKQIIEEELNSLQEYENLSPEEMSDMVTKTRSYKDIQPDLVGQELELEDFQIDDIASRLQFAGFDKAADFLRMSLSK